MDQGRLECLFRQINAFLTQYGKDSGELDLTPSQSILLEHLLACEEEEIILTKISVEAGLSMSSLSVLLKGLREKGYLTMNYAVRDNRKKEIRLTEKAYAARDRLKESLRRRGECICKGISGQELEQLERILSRMADNLNCELKQNRGETE